jgi:hypothetical protein
MDVPQNTARELALVYGDIAAALRRLEELRRVHENSGSTRFANRLAIAEGELASDRASERSIEAVVAIRQKAYAEKTNLSQAVREARKARIEQDALQKDVRNWARETADFYGSLDSLYSKTMGRLRYLNLEPWEINDAERRLEEIMKRALERFSEVQHNL